MAQRRMFSKEITTSDLFVDMPASTQLLYFHLGMEADDEGFIGNARMLGRAYGASNDDIKLLQAKGFIIVFESGVTVVKDWNVNNKLRKDRFKPTIYQDEKNLLTIMETGTYEVRHLLQESQQRSMSEKPVLPTVESLGIPNDNQMTTKPQPNDNQMTTKPQPNDNQMTTQYRIGKDRIGKDRIDEDREDTPPLVIVSEIYQSKIGVIDGDQFQQLTDYIILDGMELDVVVRAITEAADNGKRNFKYILAILRNWKQNGIKTIAQVDERERQRIESKTNSFQNGNSSQPRQTNVPTWSTEPVKTEQTTEGQARLAEIFAELEAMEGADG
ncbi:DnaD domain protein [Streptococcus suis]|nr:DnaD domain protein [Streptococcus suis]NQJ20908.1 DnaD domain protein [Streptococcus suis]NQK57394.1 DnaD domain protein [Streptococcus suis]NQN96438.1 DnaD domain protein [Streptococcus suis]